MRVTRPDTAVIARLVLVALLCPVASGHAQSSTPESKDDVAADTRKALQDMELLRRGLSTSSSGPQSAEAELPVGTVPGVGSSIMSSPKPKREESEVARAKRQDWEQRNWLIAGMSRDAAGTNAEKADGGQTSGTVNAPQIGGGVDSDRWLQAAMDAQRASEIDRQTESRNSSDAGSTVKPTDVANPLANFMKDWMHPGDYALLHDLGGMNRGSEQRSPTQTGTMTSSAMEFETSNQARIRQIEADSPSANPFLTNEPRGAGDDLTKTAAFPDLLARIPAPTELRPPVTITPASTSSLIAPAPNQTTPAAKAEEGPWRPPAREEEKYFPRLKRF